MLNIVLFEEDAAMRTLVSEWLVAEGYRVRSRAMLVAKDVDDGIGGDTDLAIVDLLDLPGQGLATVREVKRAYPRAAVVGISTQLGRSLAAESAQARALGVSRLVPKPCSRGELVGAVRAAIGQPT